MHDPLEQEYLKWLYSRIGNVDESRPSQSYWRLMSQLYETEFIWFIAKDDNRVEDGKYLRYGFLEDIRVSDDDVSQAWLIGGCSVLEMLIALANHIQFDAESSVDKWFWEMLNNCGLSSHTDYRYNAQKVDDIVQRIIWRRYDANGHGGLFPLRHPEHDQRHVDLWYQCQAYLQETH